MRLHRRGNWEDTRREIGQLAWAVAIIDLIAIGLGALASRPMGTMALKVGIGLAVVATVVFALFVGVSLGIESLMNWWITRRERRQPTHIPFR